MMWHLNHDSEGRKDRATEEARIEKRNNGFCSQTVGSGSYMRNFPLA